MMKNNNRAWVFISLAVGIALAIGDILLAGYVWMFLWNNIVSQIFNVATIGFIEAIAISLFVDFVVVDHNSQKVDKNAVDTFLFSIFIKLGYLILGVIIVSLLT